MELQPRSLGFTRVERTEKELLAFLDAQSTLDGSKNGEKKQSQCQVNLQLAGAASGLWAGLGWPKAICGAAGSLVFVFTGGTTGPGGFLVCSSILAIGTAAVGWKAGELASIPACTPSQQEAALHAQVSRSVTVVHRQGSQRIEGSGALDPAFEQGAEQRVRSAVQAAGSDAEALKAALLQLKASLGPELCFVMGRLASELTIPRAVQPAVCGGGSAVQAESGRLNASVSPAERELLEKIRTIARTKRGGALVAELSALNQATEGHVCFLLGRVMAALLRSGEDTETLKALEEAVPMVCRR